MWVFDCSVEDPELRDKELFYQKLDTMVGICPTGDVLVVLGDFNAETGSNRALYMNCVWSS